VAPGVAAPNVPRLDDIGIDSAVLLFTAGVSSQLPAFLAGIVPAIACGGSICSERLRPQAE
jgi:hypothetical protein